MQIYLQNIRELAYNCGKRTIKQEREKLRTNTRSRKRTKKSKVDNYFFAKNLANLKKL